MANFLTLTRLLLVVPTLLLFANGAGLAATACFLLAMATDGLDGWVARRAGTTTRLGVYLDPVVDKAVILLLLFELGRTRVISPLVPALFLVRELLHSGIRSAAASGGEVIGANWMGKTKAALQTILVAWGLLWPDLVESLSPGVVNRLRQVLDVFAWSVLVVAWIFFLRFAWLNRHVMRGKLP